VQTRHEGFTLIELLIVILLISIIVGIAIMVPRSQSLDSVLKDESTRLAFLFNAASEQALLSGNEVGFSFHDTQYSWWQWNRSTTEWVLMNQGSWLPHIIPDSIILSVKTAETIHLPDTYQGPTVIFYTDGLSTAATITFTIKDDRSKQLVLDTDGVSPLAEQ